MAKVLLNFEELLNSSSNVRIDVLDQINYAMRMAEILFPLSGNGRTWFGKKQWKMNWILDSFDWQNAMQTYHTWNKFKVECDNDNNYDFKMELQIKLLDLYEFEPSVHKGGGLVIDYEMWLLNYYKIAKHFKIHGYYNHVVRWKKGEKVKMGDIFPANPIPDDIYIPYP